MSIMADTDSSEDVNDFLRRIRELGDKRDKEDEERTRRLEEEILQGRRERQARRAERTRSLSPTKDSPSDFGTPNTFIDTSTDFSTIRFSTNPSRPHQLVMPSSRSKADSAGEMAQNTGEEVAGDTSSSQDTTQLSEFGSSPTTHQSSFAPPSRSSTLAWQQRPIAKSRHNFLTGSSVSESPRLTPDLGSTQEGEPSLSQIAQSLGSKDPKWFRQTADRGLGSAAYKKSEDHNAIDGFSSSESKRLPGMSRESTIEPEKESSSRTEIMRPESPSRARSLHENIARSQRFSASATTSSSPFNSPIPTLNSQRLEPQMPESAPSQESESTYTRGIAMSPSQGRLLRDRIDRPPSPTKGLGGFVQSAMLKRSESVNKRWSAQAGQGLSRGNSIASNRSGYDGSKAASNSMTSTREGKIAGQKTSPISLSRPGSSHSTSTIPKSILIDEAQARTEEASANATESQDSDGFIKPALPNISRLSLKDIDDNISGISEVTESSPPITPSKSIDTKKWAPAKASWLDNAINKPDPPKPKAIQFNQPSWMVNISKARKQRGSVDMEKSAVYKEVPTGGLLRSPPMGCNTNPTSLNGSNSNFSPRVTSKDGVDSSQDLLEKKSRSVFEKNEEATGDTVKSVEPSQAETVGEEISQTGSDMRSNISRVPSSSAEIIIKSSLAKPKPVTPPKKDFRSKLKSRQVSGDHTKEKEPEFKNVFGKLKRAQTQNYVAPDELKDNIMRGKAGLAATGGPKKTERRDELKESILKKKEEMKGRVPMNVDRKIVGSGKGNVQEGSVPKAITKNFVLGKSEDITISSPILVMTDLKVPGLEPLKQAVTEKPITKPEKQLNAPGRMHRELAGNGKLASRFNPTLAGLLSRGPSPVTSGTGSDQIKNLSNSHDNQSALVKGQAGGESSGSAQLIHATKGRARGPKRRLPTSVKQEPDLKLKSPDRENAVLKTITEKYENHSLATIPKEPFLEDRNIARPLSNIPDGSNRNSLLKPLGKPDTPTKKIVLDKIKPSSPQSPLPLDQLSTPTSATRFSLHQQPKTSPKSSKVRKPSTSIIHSPAPTTSPSQLPAKSGPHLTGSDLTLTVTAKRPLPTPPSKSMATISHEELSSHPRSGLLLSQQSHFHPLEKSDREIMNEVVHSGSPHNASFPQSQKSKSPIELPTRGDKEAITSVAELGERTAKEPIGLGIRSLPDILSAPIAHHLGLPTPPLRSPIETPKSSPLRPKKPESIANRVVSNGSLSLALPQSRTVSDANTLRAQHLIIDFFGEIPTSKTRVDVNTHKVLSSRASSDDSDKIKTLRKQIWQLSGDGKKTSIASHQEHILYGDNMYLCTHVFGSGELGTRKTEVYLWHGEAVPSSAIEDAQLFARKIAKDNNGKLIIVSQGKETSNFFQALGGIVVTRRGSSSTYMLCGRRHVGQIAFDEVPFKTGSLCSGFPYIISARFGKLYLWKGKGSGHDELGCARLIGMDLGLTGEIEEVEEGNESEDFWEAFPDRKTRFPPTGDVFWHLKPSCERFNTCLFIVDVEIPAPKSSSGLTFAWGRRGSTPVGGGNNVATITEIYPFAQSDLKSPGVFVLDTFFEIFVIPTSPKISAPTFQTALLFAQEYGILAASMEDRPFIPVSHVVLRGMPSSAKAAFRNWEEGRFSTSTKEGEEAVIPLSKAVEVCST